MVACMQSMLKVEHAHGQPGDGILQDMHSISRSAEACLTTHATCCRLCTVAAGAACRSWRQRVPRPTSTAAAGSLWQVPGATQRGLIQNASAVQARFSAVAEFWKLYCLAWCRFLAATRQQLQLAASTELVQVHKRQP